MAIFPIVIDACVLINAPVRDTLLRAAEYDLLRVHWSNSILEETERNLINKRKVPADKARKLIRQLNLAFPEALIEVPAKLINAMPASVKPIHIEGDNYLSLSYNSRGCYVSVFCCVRHSIYQLSWHFN